MDSTIEDDLIDLLYSQGFRATFLISYMVALPLALGTILITWWSVGFRHPFNLLIYYSAGHALFSMKYFGLFNLTNYNLELSSRVLCGVEAFWSQFWGTYAIVWSGSIVWTVWHLLNTPFHKTSKYEKYYHILAWALSSTTAIILVLSNSFGPSNYDGMCWFSGTTTHLMKIMYVLPLCVVIFGAFAVSVKYLKRRQLLVYAITNLFGMLCLIFAVTGVLPLFAFVIDLFRIAGVVPSSLRLATISLALFNSFQAVICFAFVVQNLSCCGKLHLKRENGVQKKTLIRIRQKILQEIMLRIQKTSELVNETGTNKLNESHGIQEGSMTLDNAGDMDDEDMRMLHEGYKRPGDKQPLLLQYKNVDYLPLMFYNLRVLSGLTSEQYLSSFNASVLNQTLESSFSEGKSDSFMLFTTDKKYIIKTIAQVEADALVQMLPEYYEHLQSTPRSMLTRFYGLLSSEVGDVENVHVLVMENMFPPHLKMKERYDMKGSWVGRRTKLDKPNRESSVLKDLDFNRKLNLTQDQRMEIRGILQRDVSFLCFHKSMDYSILLGIHKIDYNITPAEEIHGWTKRHGVYLSYDETELYFIGVIDVLTIYNIKKKLERFFKVYVMLQDSKGISVTPPQRYAERFLKKVDEIIDWENEKYNDEFVVQLDTLPSDTKSVNNLPTAGAALNER
eukprot:TRINITY_DN4299_c0_g2_i1.p1 TRINITY_DN4299_c0_g2~~TRINITY_DN4299_c0_g2_i1.p1  ORF type:complete len:675 (-),score=169.84 TRINITY_DN4299_c0_g2_i1:8-2032(-)